MTVQPYNTLLSLSNLSEVSSGILLLQNEVLHDTCTRLLGMKSPGFKVGKLHAAGCQKYISMTQHGAAVAVAIVFRHLTSIAIG